MHKPVFLEIPLRVKLKLAAGAFKIIIRVINFKMNAVLLPAVKRLPALRATVVLLLCSVHLDQMILLQVPIHEPLAAHITDMGPASARFGYMGPLRVQRAKGSLASSANSLVVDVRESNVTF